MAIYAIVFATWGLKWYFVGWGDAEMSAGQTPLYAMVARHTPQWVHVCLSLALYIFTAAVMQSIFSRVHPGQSKNYLMHLFVPLFSTLSIADDAWGSPAAALGTLTSLYVLTLLLTKEERPHPDTAFRACFAAGVAALLYYPASVLPFVVLVAMVYNNDLTVKKLLISLVGFILPFTFAAGVAVLQRMPPDTFIGIAGLAQSVRESRMLKGVELSVAVLLWGLLLLVLILLIITSKSSRSKTILTAYHDVMLRFIGFLAIVAFVVLPSSSAVPVMVAPAMGSGYVFYFTGKGKTRFRGWAFVMVTFAMIIGNVLGAEW